MGNKGTVSSEDGKKDKRTKARERDKGARQVNSLDGKVLIELKVEIFLRNRRILPFFIPSITATVIAL